MMFLSFLKKNNIFVFLLLISIIATGVIVECSERNKQQKVIRDLQTQLAHARTYKHVVSEVLSDSSTVVTHEASKIDKHAYKREFANRELLKELGVKPRDVSAQADVATNTGDSVKLASRDSVFFYRDTWATFRFSLRDSSLSYQVRDSLSTIVIREYKHRFLFWRWGTKGYKIKIVNYNPHSKITYSNYLNID